MKRLVQLKHLAHGRRVAVVLDDTRLKLLTGAMSIYELAQAALAQNTTLQQTIEQAATDEELDYDSIYEGRSEWFLLPAFDHPEEPARCLVTGTGLTHKASAENRQAMHDLTESSKSNQQATEKKTSNCH